PAHLIEPIEDSSSLVVIEDTSDHLEPVVIPVVAFEEEIPAHLIEPIEDSSSLVVIEDTSDHLEPVVIPVVAFEEEIPAHLIEPIEDSSSLVVIEGVSDSNSLEVDSANLLNNLEKLLGNTYEINYLDSKNKLSCRQVTVKKIHQDNGALYIKTYCHLSRAPRTFRIDRIVGDVINIDTGELTSLV
ncbi:MAG: WYL domain-containing protein, partial [Methylococcales bacterium]